MISWLSVKSRPSQEDPADGDKDSNDEENMNKKLCKGTQCNAAHTSECIYKNVSEGNTAGKVAASASSGGVFDPVGINRPTDEAEDGGRKPSNRSDAFIYPHMVNDTSISMPKATLNVTSTDQCQTVTCTQLAKLIQMTDRITPGPHANFTAMIRHICLRIEPRKKIGCPCRTSNEPTKVPAKMPPMKVTLRMPDDQIDVQVKVAIFVHRCKRCHAILL